MLHEPPYRKNILERTTAPGILVLPFFSKQATHLHIVFSIGCWRDHKNLVHLPLDAYLLFKYHGARGADAHDDPEEDRWESKRSSTW